ncbi:glycosyltransferase family 2 protein [Bradyrhizobium sp. 76]|nr:glycosyltransferase family 2 protein [Bradyrhizobium sp. 76]
MTTYNGGKFLGEQLSSLADQIYPNLELIISDDGSTDNTMEIVDEFRRTAKFPVVVRRNNARLGYAENFLSATKLATGEFLAFCDQDDKWRPEKLAIAVEALMQSKADLFVHAATLIDATGSEIGYFSQGICKSATLEPLQLGPWAVFYGCSMVFPRQLLELIDSCYRGAHTFEFEGALSHDLWVYFLATSLGRVVVDSRPLIAYRQHPSNQTPHVRASWLRAWWSAAGVAAHPKLARSSIAHHRGRLLEDLSKSTSRPIVRQAAMRAAQYWRRISRYEHMRVEFYAAAGLSRRTFGWTRLVLEGGYLRFEKGGLGWQLSVKDLLVGVWRARRPKRKMNVVNQR